jgi:predicted amidophosphoribosyltransferase
MERQFNQAEEIARSISMETGLPVSRLLKRARRTETQTRLSRKQRMENLRGAFTLRESFPENAPPGYLLVDDVFTTGSTVDECAKVLRKAGAGRIAVLTVMRG